MRARECLAMKSIQWKQHVARDEEFRVWIAPRCVGRKRIIARHVRVHNLDLVPAHKARQLVRTWNVERVAQRQGFDVRLRQPELRD